LANGSSSTLPWVIALVASTVAAGAIGFAGGRMTAPVASAPEPLQPAQTASAEPELPPGATTQVIEDWTLFCQANPAGETLCFATQEIRRPEGGLLFALIAGYDVNASKTLLVRAPLGVQLDKGVEFKFGETQQDAFQFDACGNGSCDAILTMTEEGFVKLTEAGAFELAYTRGDGTRVPATVSMKGLAKAYESIRKPTVAPAAAAPAATPAAPAAPSTAAPDGTPEPTPKPAAN
jgi:invasion protein IalB